MALPNAENAVIEESKIRDYLLSASHRIGRYKAAFFASLGYSASDWPLLASDLRVHAQAGEATPSESSAYGQKFEVRGSIEGPAGKRAVLVAVWIVLKDESAPRFVTAYPGVRS